jgi:5'-3' exonuclease
LNIFRFRRQEYNDTQAVSTAPVLHPVSSRAKFASNIDMTPAPLTHQVFDPNASVVANRKTSQEANKEAAKKLKEALLSEEPIEENKEGNDVDITKRKFDAIADDDKKDRFPTPLLSPMGDDDDEPFDDVRLWELDAKERYYQSKFQVSVNDKEFAKG